MIFAPAAVFAGCGRQRRTSRARIRRAHFHPGDQIVDLRVGKFLALRRHLQVRIGVTDGFDQQTFFRIAGNDRRARVAAFLPAAFPIELQAAFDFAFGRAVTLVAIVGEDRTNFVFEEIELRLGRLRACAARTTASE